MSHRRFHLQGSTKWRHKIVYWKILCHFWKSPHPVQHYYLNSTIYKLHKINSVCNAMHNEQHTNICCVKVYCNPTKFYIWLVPVLYLRTLHYIISAGINSVLYTSVEKRCIQQYIFRLIMKENIFLGCTVKLRQHYLLISVHPKQMYIC